MQELIKQLIAAVEETLASGEVLPDELQGEIADLLERLTRIEGGQPEKPPLTPAMPSSNIDAFAYDPKTQKLLVRFLGDYPNREGPIYSYEGVPNVIFDLFQKGAIPARTDGENQWGKWWKGKVPSIGASMYTLIKSANYPYQKLT